MYSLEITDEELREKFIHMIVHGKNTTTYKYHKIFRFCFAIDSKAFKISGT